MPETVETSEIVKDEEILGGAARIKGTRIRVSDIVISREYRTWSPHKIAEQFPTVSISDVYAALDYYEGHKREIRREIQEREQKFKEAVKKQED